MGSIEGRPTTSSSVGGPWSGLLRELACDRVDRIVFVAAAIVVGFGYSVMLPFAFTQRVSLANWHYLDARYIVFTVAFALAFAWLMTMQVHATRSVLAGRRTAGGVARRGGPVGALAAVVSILPSLLCCSPILPSLVAFVGLSGATSLQLQYVFATKETLFLVGTLVLLIAMGLWSTRKLARARCTGGQSCATPGRVRG